MKNLLLVSILLLFLPCMIAENGIEVVIKNDTLNIRGYTTDVIYGKVDFGFFDKLNDKLNVSLICDEIIINNNGTNNTYQENCNVKIDYKKDIPIYTVNQTSSSIIGDSKLWNDLKMCEELKSQYRAGLDLCIQTKNEREDLSQNFSQCNSEIIICRNDKIRLQEDVNSLKEDIEDNKNRQWWFLIVGIIVGGVIIMIKEGKIGGPKHKSDDEVFNRRMAT